MARKIGGSGTNVKGGMQQRDGLSYALAQRNLRCTDAQRSDPTWLSEQRDEQREALESALLEVRKFCRQVLAQAEHDPERWSFDFLKAGQKLIERACSGVRDVALYNRLLADAAAAGFSHASSEAEQISRPAAVATCHSRLRLVWSQKATGESHDQR